MISTHVLLIIPARKGSKRILNKNVISICGKPLIEYTILAAKHSRFADRIVITTDDPAVKEIGNSLGIELINRPPLLASNEAKSIDAVLHAMTILKEKKYEPDIIVLLQPTSPLRTSEEIDTAISIIRFTDADSVKSVVEIRPNPKWGIELAGSKVEKLFEGDYSKRSQDLRPIYAPNGAIYAARTDVINKKKSFDGEKLCPLIMDAEHSIDLDEYRDIDIVESIIRSRTFRM